MRKSVLAVTNLRVVVPTTLDDGSVRGGGSLVAFTDLEANAECDEKLGEAQPSARMSGLVDSFEECFDGGRAAGPNSASPARPHARVSGFDDSSEELFGDGCAGGARVSGFDDSSEEICGGCRDGAGSDTERAARRTRHRRRNALLERRIEESRCFQPDEVDPGRCQAM